MELCRGYTVGTGMKTVMNAPCLRSRSKSPLMSPKQVSWNFQSDDSGSTGSVVSDALSTSDCFDSHSDVEHHFIGDSEINPRVSFVPTSHSVADSGVVGSSSGNRLQWLASKATSALQAAEVSNAAKAAAEAKLDELSKQNSDLQTCVEAQTRRAEHAESRCKELVSQAASVMKAASNSDDAMNAAEARIRELEKQNAALVADLHFQKSMATQSARRAAEEIQAAQAAARARAVAEASLADILSENAWLRAEVTLLREKHAGEPRVPQESRSFFGSFFGSSEIE
eukprot:TRINITY_DN43785_c0_g1_i1.p1 TRINITY_DN43785_c0_g1~~TRINITY_DN43785_c0_g1_i1.p1  ORF type:complete len:284 (+),score=57.65 TRINITY_DN43785_c0_g1_i1:63-914(+)